MAGFIDSNLLEALLRANQIVVGLDDPKNDLFFVGYQAAGTLGRAILEGRSPAKAAIHRMTGYSAHADQQTLCNWVASMPKPPDEIRLVHGEPHPNRYGRKIERLAR